MVSFCRFPRLFASFSVLTVALAISCDVLLLRGFVSVSHALLVFTVISLVITCALMCCRIFIDDNGVGVSTLFHRRRIHWSDFAAIGWMKCNGRRVYLYGMSMRHASFPRLIVRAPFCGPGRFVVPDSKKLRAALQRFCPFPPDYHFGEQKHVGGISSRVFVHAIVDACLLLPFGLLACYIGGQMTIRSFTSNLSWGDLIVGCVMSSVCVGVGAFLLHRTFTALFFAPSISQEGISVGRESYGLSFLWGDVSDVWQMSAGLLSTLYVYNRTPPSGRVAHKEDGTATPAREPLSILSLADTRIVLLGIKSYFPRKIENMSYLRRFRRG